MPSADDAPKYVTVADAIEAQIQKGRWDGGKMPSVRQIAEQQGVSVVTASRALQVLRDKGLIRTVERAGCFRVPAASADRWALCLRLTPGPWQAATRSNTQIGFESLARRDPMHLDTGLFPVTAGTTDREAAGMARAAKDVGVGGLFLLPSRHSDEEAAADARVLAGCRAEGLPVVLLERNLRGPARPLEADLVAVDDLDAAARCTRHLLDVGRRRVALAVASPTSSHDDRVAGYLFALAQAARAPRKGVDYTPRVLYQAGELPLKQSYARLADEVLAAGADGVVCYQDYTAMGLIVELLTRGKAVPRDVAVTGADDLPIGSSFSLGITTYTYPGEAMAEHAVRLMRDRRRHPDRPPAKVSVPGALIVRESSTPSPART